MSDLAQTVKRIAREIEESIMGAYDDDTASQFHDWAEELREALPKPHAPDFTTPTVSDEDLCAIHEGLEAAVSE